MPGIVLLDEVKSMAGTVKHPCGAIASKCSFAENANEDKIVVRTPKIEADIFPSEKYFQRQQNRSQHKDRSI